MAQKLFNPILGRSWLRIGLAVVLLIAGLAPIGVPILSDNSWRVAQPGPETATLETAQPFMYETISNSDGWTRVRRSDDGAATWQDVAAIPVPVSELVAVAGNEQVVYARAAASIWVSEDAGATWSQTASLPSHPMSLAVAGDKTGTVYVGTESMGVQRSNNRGQTWLSLDSPAFKSAAAVPLGVTALAINPEDQQIVYAATGFWLGTSQVRFNPLGVFMSADSGNHWFQMSSAELGSPQVDKIEPVASKPLAVKTVDATGTHSTELALNEALLASLDDPNAGQRAAAARVIGLTGDKSVVPVLLTHLQTESDALAGEQIAGALGRLGDQSVVPALLEALDKGNEMMQARSAYALGLLRTQDAVPLLARTLQDGMPMAQRSAAEALAAVGTPEAIAALRAPLSERQMTSARNAAMIGLEVAGERAVNSLTQALGDRNPVLRTNAAEMLGWLKAGQATAELSRALSDGDAGVRTQAAWALGEIGTPEAGRALAGAIPSETNAEVRQTAQTALARLSPPAANRASPGTEWTAGLVGVLSTIPVGKWAFMTVAMALAVLLLLAGSRQAQARTV